MARPKWPVTGQTPLPRRVATLETCATPRPDVTGDRWIGGISFDPDGCDFDGAALDGAGPTMTISDHDPSSPLEYRPFLVWEGAKASTIGSSGGDGVDLAARARRKLERSTSYQVEVEFWGGALAQGAADYAGNAYLTDGNVTQLNGGAATPLLYALADLQAAAAAGHARGYIHATIPTVTLWLAAGGLRREQNLLLDAFDNVIVAGAGYDGSDPDGAVDATGETAWAYVTGPVDLLLSPIDTSTPGDYVDFTANTREHYAVRWAAPIWDGCVQSGVNVDLCSPCCEPSGS